MPSTHVRGENGVLWTDPRVCAMSRSQIALPLNFDQVPLNKALDQRLRDAGIEPPPVVKT